MTFRWKQKGFWFWKKYVYTLLDDVAELEFSSPQPLTPKECDVIFDNALKLRAARGQLKTAKGRINYKFNPKTWTDEKTNKTSTGEVHPTGGAEPKSQ